MFFFHLRALTQCRPNRNDESRDSSLGHLARHSKKKKVVSLSVRCYVQLYPKSQCGHVIKIQDQDSIKGKTLPVPDQTMLKTTSKAKCYLIQTNYTQDYLRDNITLFQSKPNSRISRRQNVTLFQLIINLRYIFI